MKKILIALLMLMPLLASAQDNTWERIEVPTHFRPLSVLQHRSQQCHVLQMDYINPKYQQLNLFNMRMVIIHQ